MAGLAGSIRAIVVVAVRVAVAYRPIQDPKLRDIAAGASRRSRDASIAGGVTGLTPVATVEILPDTAVAGLVAGCPIENEIQVDCVPGAAHLLEDEGLHTHLIVVVVVPCEIESDSVLGPTHSHARQVEAASLARANARRAPQLVEAVHHEGGREGGACRVDVLALGRGAGGAARPRGHPAPVGEGAVNQVVRDVGSDGGVLEHRVVEVDELHRRLLLYKLCLTDGIDIDAEAGRRGVGAGDSPADVGVVVCVGGHPGDPHLQLDTLRGVLDDRGRIVDRERGPGARLLWVAYAVVVVPRPRVHVVGCREGVRHISQIKQQIRRDEVADAECRHDVGAVGLDHDVHAGGRQAVHDDVPPEHIRREVKVVPDYAQGALQPVRGADSPHRKRYQVRLIPVGYRGG